MAEFEDQRKVGFITAAQASATPEVQGGIVSLTLRGGMASCIFQLGGVFSAGTTIVFETTIDNINWYPIPLFPVGLGSVAPVTSTVGGATVEFTGSCAAVSQVRARCAVYTTNDNVTVTVRASVAPAIAGGGSSGTSSGPLPAGTSQIGVVDTNATRSAAVVHRNAITAIDKVGVVGTITLTGQTGGGLTSGTTYFVGAAAGNNQGSAGASAIVSAAPGGSNATMRAAFATVSNATYYDIFLSTAAAPLWVARITEAQRLSGCLVTAVGTVGAGGAANSVDIQLQGTQLASNVAPFTSNNAYLPVVVAAVGFVNCAGKSIAHIKTLMAVTDLRSLPALNIVPFLKNGSDSLWDQCQLVTVPTLTTTGQALRQDYVMNVDGSTGLVVLIDAISGNGAACTVTVELS